MCMTTESLNGFSLLFPQTILNCCHKVAVIYMIKANSMIFCPFMGETWYNLMGRHSSRPRTASELKHTNEKTYHGIRRWTTTDKRLTGIPKYLYLILEFLTVFWHIPANIHGEQASVFATLNCSKLTLRITVKKKM